MTRDDLIYTAGFFDADGTVGVYWIKSGKCKRGRMFILRASIAQKKRLPLFDALYAEFGGSIGFSQATGWCWTVSCQKAKIFLEAICPHLRNKKEQADLAIEFQSRVKYRGAKPIPDDEIEVRRHLAQQIKDLKR